MKIFLAILLALTFVSGAIPANADGVRKSYVLCKDRETSTRQFKLVLQTLLPPPSRSAEGYRMIINKIVYIAQVRVGDEIYFSREDNLPGITPSTDQSFLESGGNGTLFIPEIEGQYATPFECKKTHRIKTEEIESGNVGLLFDSH